MIGLPRAVHVINLDTATDRLSAVMASFQAHMRASGIALDRFAAVDAAQAKALRIPGTLTWAEKACFASHLRCIQVAAGASRPAWIAEDDVVFGRQTQRRLDAALAAIGDRPWDLLFTNIHATSASGMADLFRIDRKLRAKGATDVLDLADMAFIGAPSYLVNPASVARILDLAERCHRLDMAWDIWLKYLAGTGQLTCLCVLPFATCVAEEAPTQIQPDAFKHQIGWWTAFSRLMWDGTDPAALDRELAGLEVGSTDERAARLGRIVAGLMSESFSSADR